jgi:hypothetical protein
MVKDQKKMPSLLQDFGQTAQRLARNPLGTIALFIVLVYGIAGLVLGVSSGSLEPSERQPLVWFLVVFPLVVLVAFYRLVTVHHVKLYAPHDFPDADGFFRALTPSEQKDRLEQEIRELETTPGLVEGEKDVPVEMEGTGLMRGLSTRHAWVLAEEVAFRELESEFGASIQRQVAVAGDFGVDGVFLDKGKIRIVEIKFTRQPGLAHIARRAAEQLGLIAENLKPASFIIAIVVEGVPSERELERAQEQLKSMPFPVDLRVYDFDELKRKYGVDEKTA